MPTKSTLTMGWWYNRLSPKNLVKVDQILSVLRSVTRYLEKKIAEHKSAKKEWSFVINVNDFLHQAQIDNVNLFHLQAYFERSQISKKLNGFALKHVEAVQLKKGGTEYVSKHVSALRIVESFFEGLTNVRLSAGRRWRCRGGGPLVCVRELSVHSCGRALWASYVRARVCTPRAYVSECNVCWMSFCLWGGMFSSGKVF